MFYNSPHGFSWKWGMPPMSSISKFGFEDGLTINIKVIGCSVFPYISDKPNQTISNPHFGRPVGTGAQLFAPSCRRLGSTILPPAMRKSAALQRSAAHCIITTCLLITYHILIIKSMKLIEVVSRKQALPLSLSLSCSLPSLLKTQKHTSTSAMF